MDLITFKIVVVSYNGPVNRVYGGALVTLDVQLPSVLQKLLDQAGTFREPVVRDGQETACKRIEMGSEWSRTMDESFLGRGLLVHSHGP